MWDSVVEEIKGDGLVESMIVKNVKTGELTEIKADEEDGTFGIFVFIGFKPNSDLFDGKVQMDERKYIITDDDMKTDIPGVFAAGDIRKKSLRQVVTAAADGAPTARGDAAGLAGRVVSGSVDGPQPFQGQDLPAEMV